MRDYVLAAADPWFPQATGTTDADAATLLLPAFGLVAADDPRVAATVDAVCAQLAGPKGLLHRYRSADGLRGGEGAFLLCSFWLVDVLVHAGQLARAEEMLLDLLALANDVGIYAEEVDPVTGEHLGNTPQAFTHMALVASCAHLSAAKAGRLPDDGLPYDFAELALLRLLEDAGDGARGSGDDAGQM